MISSIFMLAAGAADAASCPTNAVEIGAPQQYIFPTSQQSNIVFITYMTMGRRSPALYTATKYGVAGVYLGSTPADPTPTIDNISFRTNPKGPVGGGTGKDCWPGPSSIAVADQTSGAGRIAMGWSGGCGSPAQVAIANVPGGQSTFGQQIDAAGGGGAVFGGTVATALTPSGSYAAYFADSSATYVIDVTNPTGNATSTPLGPIQTLSAWAGVNYLFAIGNANADQYVAGVFFKTKTVQIASVGNDGRLTVLSTNAALSSGGATGSNEQKTAIYSTGSGYYLFIAVANGIDVFSLQSGQLSRLGTIPNASSTDKYTLIQVPSQSPSPVVFAERSSSHQIDVYAGGFLTGQSGAPALSTSFPALSNDFGSGFGAYVSATDRNTAYIYRVISVTDGVGLQTDTFDITCVASPATPNPTASFSLVNKSAQNRADKSNYVGDTFSLTDSSQAGTGGAITNWYLWPVYNAATSTKANASLPNSAAPSYANLVLPCTGGISSGQCSYSSGTITGSTVNETFGELVSAGALDSPVNTRQVALTVPTTHVAGQNVDGSVKLLSGSGQLDASSSTGSPLSFTWSFEDAQSGSLTTSCASAKCTPPANAAHFGVAADYAGGYQSNFVNGTIAFTDVAGSISVPATVFSSQGTIPVTIALQKGGSVAISSITESIDNAAPSTLTVTLAGNSGGSNSVTGSTTIPIPGGLSTGQGHTITFGVNYTGGNLGTNVAFADSFLFSTVAYNPSISISNHNATPPDNNAFNPFGNTYSLVPNATYYFGDMNDFPLPSQPATWEFGDGNQSTTTTGTLVTHSYSGSGNKTVQLTVQGVTTSVSISLSGTPPPSFSVGNISGPSSVTTGSSGTFAASVSGGTSPYTYSWTSSDNGSALTSTFSHTFNASGTFTVSLTASDSAGHSQTKTKTVTVSTGGCTSGCGGGPNQIVIGGSASAVTGTPASWTASVSGATGSLSISWSLTGNGVNATGLGTTFTYNFAAPGTYTLNATGNEIVGASPITLNPASKTITVSQGGPPPPSPAFSIVGATFTQFANPQYSAKAGDVITFQAAETADSPTFAWDFGDSGHGTGATVTHAFQQKATYTVKLTVTNGHQLSASSQTKIGITGQAFSALFIPGAGHLESSGGAYATALSVFNNSASAVKLDFDFETVTPSKSLDPSKLSYPFTITLQPHQGASTTDVNAVLGKGSNDIGTLFIKYSGAVPPSVQARIYFSSGSAGDPTYGTYLPAYSTNGSGQSLGGVSTAPQNIVGLKFDNDFKGGITIVSASQSGGNFDVSLFRDDGTQAGTTLHMTISGFQQIKLAAADFNVSPDPGHIYYAIVSPSAGASPAPAVAIGTVTDNRTHDSLLLIDDTPRLATPPGGSAIYYVAGAGRTTSGAKTDLYLLNTSAYGINNLNFRFHFMDGTGEHTAQVPELQFIGAHQALQISDVITSLFPGIVGQVVGDLRIDYQVPNDNAPLIIEARNYTDPGTGSYGMQLPAYAATDGLVSGSASQIVIAGLHNDADNVSKFGFVALGDTPVTVHVDAYDQSDSSLFWSGDYALNGSTFGHFVYQPTTGPGTDAFTAHPAFNLVITAPSISNGGGTPVAAFATVQDVNSKDLVFVPGKKPASAQ